MDLNVHGEIEEEPIDPPPLTTYLVCTYNRHYHHYYIVACCNMSVALKLDQLYPLLLPIPLTYA